MFFAPDQGGAPNRITIMANELKTKGIDVNVITTLPSYPAGKIYEGYRNKFFVKEVRNGITCRRYWMLPSNSNNPYVRVFSMLSFSMTFLLSIPYLLKRQPDVFLIQSPHLPIACTATIVGKLLRKKVILNVSDLWPNSALELGVIKSEKSFSYRVLKKMERIMYANADAFVGQSNEILNYLKEVDVSKPRLLYRNLMKPSPYTSAKSPSSKKKIIYAGLLGMPQGIYRICTEIDFNLLDMEFHIYGQGVEREKIEDFISTHPNSNIFLHNQVPKEEIQTILKDYDATIISLKSSLLGAFPSKINMAIAAELPIIIAANGEAAQVVDEYKLGFASPAGDIEGLHHNLIRLNQLSAEEYIALKENIARIRDQHFDYNKQQQLLFDFVS